MKIKDEQTSPLEKLQAVSMVLDIQEKMSPTQTDNKEAFSQAATLRKEFITASGEFAAMRDSYNRILASANNPSPAGDLSVIFNYMKMLDPQSVVRESEFATAQNSGSIPERIRSLYNRVVSGERLTEVQRSDFINRSKEIYEATSKQNDHLVEEYVRLANNFGLDPNNIIIDMEIYDSINTKSGSSGGGFTDGETKEVPGVGTYTRQGGQWILSESTVKTGGQVDPKIVESLTAAIKSQESGGKQVSGQSGEFGMFQFLPATWNTISSEYNKAMTGESSSLEQTPNNEDDVAKWKIAQLLSRGHSPYEVALIWNTSLGGQETPMEKKGVNSSGIAYDSAAYANKVVGKMT
jgi:hypothetical protein